MAYNQLNHVPHTTYPHYHQIFNEKSMAFIFIVINIIAITMEMMAINSKKVTFNERILTPVFLATVYLQ